jgi:hypothetical protein
MIATFILTDGGGNVVHMSSISHVSARSKTFRASRGGSETRHGTESGILGLNPWLYRSSHHASIRATLRIYMRTWHTSRRVDEPETK